MHFNGRIDVKSRQIKVKEHTNHENWRVCLTEYSNAISRSRAACHSVCLKSMSSTITIQVLTPAALNATQKHTLMLDSTLNHDSHSSAISRSMAPEHNVYLKSMSRTITMQGLTLAAITASQQRTLMLDST